MVHDLTNTGETGLVFTIVEFKGGSRTNPAAVDIPGQTLRRWWPREGVPQGLT